MHTSYNIDLYNRTPKSQLKVTHADSTFQKEIETLKHPKKNKNYNLLILCLKEHQVRNAIADWKSHISSKTQLLIIRNGINHVDQVKNLIDTNLITAAIIDCPTQASDDGYWQLKKAIVNIPTNTQQQSIIEVFKETKVEIVVSANFHLDCWLKLCLSASLGATQCRYNGTCSIFKFDDAVTYFSELLMESTTIANADDAGITKAEIQSLLIKIKQYPPTKGSSMLRDFQAKKRIELGAKNGAIVDIAKALKISARKNIEFIEWLGNNVSNSK